MAVRALQAEDAQGPQDSGIGSSPTLSQQYDDLTRELEAAKHRNTWLASELALARKSGYAGQQHRGPSASVASSSAADSPVAALEGEGSGEGFADEDKPLIEALPHAGPKASAR